MGVPGEGLCLVPAVLLASAAAGELGPVLGLAGVGHGASSRACGPKVS